MAVGGQARGRDRTDVAQPEYGYLHLASWRTRRYAVVMEPANPARYPFRHTSADRTFGPVPVGSRRIKRLGRGLFERVWMVRSLGSHVIAMRLPLVRRGSHSYVRRPGDVPALRELRPSRALDEAEVFYPLHVRLCDSCLLVQLPAYVPGEDIFSDYAYFSSYSDSWVAHAKRYALAMIGASRSHLGQPGHRGGEQRRVPPAALRGRGYPGPGRRAGGERGRGGPGARASGRWSSSSDRDTGERDRRPIRGRADLVAANNVFAHVPDIRGFAAGLRALVKDTGVVTLEFPHLLRLIERRQYDTIYHEHYSYLSLLTASRALATAGLRVVDVDELGTHGGSLRVYARPEESAGEPSTRVKEVLDEEESAGLHTVEGHAGFAARGAADQERPARVPARGGEQGRSVAGYGAPGKGNTLLNHCGIRADLLAYTVDRSPFKQGKFLPGTHIPIYAPERLAETRPDYILVLPWNLRDEISRQLELRPVMGRATGLSDP